MAEPFAFARIIHEGFYCNRRYENQNSLRYSFFAPGIIQKALDLASAVATHLTAGGLAARLVNILFQVCLPPSQLRAPVSPGISAVSSRTLVNNAGYASRNGSSSSVVRLSSEEKSIWRIARGRRAYGLWLEIRSF